MADKKKTTNLSVFEHLAKRFSECRKEIKGDKVMFASDTPNVMFTAGKALFSTISSNKIDLGDIPDWFTIEPDGIRIDRNGNDRVYLTWDWYWLCAIKWLAKNKPDSGITFSVYLHGVNPEDSLHSGYNVTDYLMGLFRLSDEHLKRTWRQLARASEDACLYLARKAIKEPTETEQKVRSSFKKIIGWIVEVIIALALLVIFLCFFGVVTGIFVFAAMLTIFHLLGWLEPIRAFISNIVSNN